MSPLSQRVRLAAVGLSDTNQSVFWKHRWFGSSISPSPSSAFFLKTSGVSGGCWGWREADLQAEVGLGQERLRHPWDEGGGCWDQPKPRHPIKKSQTEERGGEAGRRARAEGNSSRASGRRERSAPTVWFVFGAWRVSPGSLGCKK